MYFFYDKMTQCGLEQDKDPGKQTTPPQDYVWVVTFSQGKMLPPSPTNQYGPPSPPSRQLCKFSGQRGWCCCCPCFLPRKPITLTSARPTLFHENSTLTNFACTLIDFWSVILYWVHKKNWVSPGTIVSFQSWWCLQGVHIFNTHQHIQLKCV